METRDQLSWNASDLKPEYIWTVGDTRFVNTLNKTTLIQIHKKRMKIKSGDKTSINNTNKDNIVHWDAWGGTYHDTYIMV